MVFTDGRGGREALELYRSSYCPSERHPQPNTGICVWALAAETEAEAQHHYTPRAKWQLFRNRGIYSSIDPPEVAAAYPYTADEAARLAELRHQAFVGTPEQVAAQIRDLAETLAVQEVAVVTWTHDETIRRQSYRLLADVFGLTGDAAAIA